MISYFYFSFFNSTFSVIHEISNSAIELDTMLFLIIPLLPLLFVFLMNTTRISSYAYKIPKSQLGSINTLAILIGISLTILLAMDIAEII
ncbi:hypothetical protein SAMN04487910_2204 [Aquimarina amphilecti]|uniref:Uncharacterized protein n=1 Tax=Aquimarina amphilecti TaxID=1038014 RepID=A0A1H7PH21_AQUAM|nr:hypothetical protein [Aquimarina amphilecti]SEL34768.1 hypothetical protein SAMN04487910_2204 [Aquimarina amphilecti]